MVDLAIGTTTEVPPTPRSFNENRRFLSILNEVLETHATQDEDLKAAAQAFASPGGTTLGSRAGKKNAYSGGAGGASDQGGAGGGGAGGYVHLSDVRVFLFLFSFFFPLYLFPSVRLYSKKSSFTMAWMPFQG